MACLQSSTSPNRCFLKVLNETLTVGVVTFSRDVGCLLQGSVLLVGSCYHVTKINFVYSD